MSREDEIRERVEKATKGPWSHNDEWIFDSQGWSFILDIRGDNPVANADFIANAPADIGYLLSEVARLRRENERLAQANASALADTERIDHLEKTARWNEDEDSDGDVYGFRVSDWIAFGDMREASPKTLREAIDERRKE